MYEETRYSSPSPTLTTYKIKVMIPLNSKVAVVDINKI